MGALKYHVTWVENDNTFFRVFSIEAEAIAFADVQSFAMIAAFESLPDGVCRHCWTLGARDPVDGTRRRFGESVRGWFKR